MYAMTAAHPTLPLPSYARVTNVATGKSVVVRVNDRGPFLHNRVIDLSYCGRGADWHRRRRAAARSKVEAILPSPPPCDASVREGLPPVVSYRRKRSASPGRPPSEAAPTGPGREPRWRVRRAALERSQALPMARTSSPMFRT
jgi:rare lipoprotein A